jgi:hypothetical protein
MGRGRGFSADEQMDGQADAPADDDDDDDSVVYLRTVPPFRLGDVVVATSWQG